MRVELTEVLWLEEHRLSIGELAQLSDLPLALVHELVAVGAITPLQEQVPEQQFGAPAVHAARSARRLREAFGLDTDALAVALALLERVASLESQLRELRAKQPGPAP